MANHWWSAEEGWCGDGGTGVEGSVGGKSGGHSAGCVAEWLCVGAVRCRAVSSFMLSSDKKVMGDGAAYAPLFRQIYSFFLP